MKRLLLLLLVLVPAVRAQQIPLVLGGVLETGTGTLPDGSSGAGIVRITPFVGVWMQSFGYLRIGYGLWDHEQTDSTGHKLEIRQRDLNVQLGVALGGPDRPYVIAGYTRARNLTSLGDADWNEWGLGLGNRFQVSPYAAFVTEIEYRWVGEHFDLLHERDVKGTRLQLSAGIAVYVY